MSDDDRATASREMPAPATLDAVHDDDLEQFLEDLGELSRFDRGDAKCAFCRDVITRSNLHAIYPDSGQVKYSCNRPVCVIKLFEMAGDPARD
jgi:hypothetical protein